jgi:hypothetical protein
VIDSLPNQQFAYVDVGFAPRPEKIPARSQRTPMREFFPIFPPEKPSRDDIVYFFFGLDHSIVPILSIIELPM